MLIVKIKFFLLKVESIDTNQPLRLRKFTTFEHLKQICANKNYQCYIIVKRAKMPIILPSEKHFISKNKENVRNLFKNPPKQKNYA